MNYEVINRQPIPVLTMRSRQEELDRLVSMSDSQFNSYLQSLVWMDSDLKFEYEQLHAQAALLREQMAKDVQVQFLQKYAVPKRTADSRLVVGVLKASGLFAIVWGGGYLFFVSIKAMAASVAVFFEQYGAYIFCGIAALMFVAYFLYAWIFQEKEDGGGVSDSAKESGGKTQITVVHVHNN